MSGLNTLFAGCYITAKRKNHKFTTSKRLVSFNMHR